MISSQKVNLSSSIAQYLVFRTNLKAFKTNSLELNCLPCSTIWTYEK